MTFLVILCAIVLFFVLLFSLDLRLDAEIGDIFTLRAGLGPFMLTVTPKKKRKVDPKDFSFEKHRKRLEKERKKAQKKAEKKRLKAEKKAADKADAERAKKDAKAAGETIEKKKFPFGFILALVRFVFRELDDFIGYFRVEIVRLHVTAGGKDAAAVAKTYGIVSAALPNLVELLNHKTRLKKLKPNAVSVDADFLLEKTKIDAHIRLKLRVGCIIRVALHALVWFIKQKIKEAKSNVTLPEQSPAAVKQAAE